MEKRGVMPLNVSGIQGEVGVRQMLNCGDDFAGIPMLDATDLVAVSWLAVTRQIGGTDGENAVRDAEPRKLYNARRVSGRPHHIGVASFQPPVVAQGNSGNPSNAPRRPWNSARNQAWSNHRAVTTVAGFGNPGNSFRQFNRGRSSHLSREDRFGLLGYRGYRCYTFPRRHPLKPPV
jgi:hypothetical protein